jgi:SnoaL-like domain
LSASDRDEIRRCVENWVVWRDAGDWDRFATVWHSNGWMSATWFQGSASEFIRVSKEGFERGVSILHALNGWSCDISGTRAISQAKMNIFQRAPLDGVPVDVTCWGRFYDFFEQRAGTWKIVRRQPIYEKDRLDLVDPSATLTLDQALLSTFPDGYKHLGYLQSRNGFTVKMDMPGLRGPEVQKVYAEGKAWLAGAATAGDAYRS